MKKETGKVQNMPKGKETGKGTKNQKKEMPAKRGIQKPVIKNKF